MGLNSHEKMKPSRRLFSSNVKGARACEIFAHAKMWRVFVWKYFWLCHSRHGNIRQQHQFIQTNDLKECVDIESLNLNSQSQWIERTVISMAINILSLALYRPHTRHLSSSSHRSIFQCIVPAVVIVICLPVTSSHTCHGIRSDCLSSVFDGMLMPMPSARDFFAIFIRHPSYILYPVNILMAAFSALVPNNTNTDIDRENERGSE